MYRFLPATSTGQGYKYASCISATNSISLVAGLHSHNSNHPTLAGLAKHSSTTMLFSFRLMMVITLLASLVSLTVAAPL